MSNWTHNDLERMGAGMHLAFGIAGGVLVLALGAAWVFMRTGQVPSHM